MAQAAGCTEGCQEKREKSSECWKVDLYPHIGTLTECCQVCKVAWTEDAESDMLSFFRMCVNSAEPDIQLSIATSVARAVLEDNCAKLQKFIHKIFVQYQSRLSDIDLDAKRGHLHLRFRISVDRMDKYKAMLEQYLVVQDVFFGFFSPQALEQLGDVKFTCECQPVPFADAAGGEKTEVSADCPAESPAHTHQDRSRLEDLPGGAATQTVQQAVVSSPPPWEGTPVRLPASTPPAAPRVSQEDGAGEGSQASISPGTTEADTMTSGGSESDEEFDSADSPALAEASRRVRMLEESVTAGSDRMKRIASEIANSIHGLWQMVQEYRARQQQVFSQVLPQDLALSLPLTAAIPQLAQQGGGPALRFTEKRGNSAHRPDERPTVRHQATAPELGDDDLAQPLSNTYADALRESEQEQINEGTQVKTVQQGQAAANLERALATIQEGSAESSSRRPPDVRPKTSRKSNLFDQRSSELKQEAQACLQQLGVSESEVLIFSLMRALFEDGTEDTPRAKGMDTVLVLDCSDSMRGAPLQLLKQTALDFIAGIEGVAEESGLEENIGVVAMSNGATVVQHLTNDYERVQHAIESLTASGLSPLFEAMCVAVAEARKVGGVVNASGCHRITPRVIFFTDGHATHETREGGHDSDTDANVRVRIVRLVQHIDKRSSGPRPLVWVPIGDNSSPLLQTLASICKGSGMLVEPGDIRSLCSYYLEQDAIGKVYSCAKHVGKSKEQVEAVIPALVENLSQEQRNRVVEAVMNKVKSREGGKGEGQATDWDNIKERPELPPLGTRVTRGPEWKWQNQDTEGPGTVINHDDERHLVWVTWDNGSTNCYRCGFENAYDVLPVEVEQYPRLKVPGEMIDIGYTVVRGPDWDKEDQDGGEGNMGIVIRKMDDGKVKVRWTNNGFIGSYQFGKNGKYDLQICWPTLQHEDLLALTYPGPGQLSSLPVQPARPASEETGMPVWQWKDGTEWRDFSLDITEQIEKIFIRGGRTTIFHHNGESYRILIKQNLARPIDNSSGMPNYEVRRFLR